jgi:hypothetical protein
LKHSFAILMLILCASGCRAQTVSPIVAEFGKKANGAFQITNNTVQPMVVSLESYSFSLDSKGQHFRKLDATTHVTLSESSARLSPREVHEFNYRITCDVLPCYTTILSGMIVGKTQDGIQVRLILPHSVYTCQKKASKCREQALKEAGLLAKK